MKSQVYKLDTTFNFGKHKGKTLRSIILNNESKYIGFLIFEDVSWFIMDLDTINFLEGKGFFDDIHMSYYGNGGTMPLSSFGLDKESIVNYLKSKYDEYIRDPEEYERKALAKKREYFLNKNAENSIHQNNSNDESEDYDSYTESNIEDNFDELMDEEEVIMRALKDGEGERLGYG